MASGAGSSTAMDLGTLGTQLAMDHGPGPKQLVFGPHGSGQHQAVSPKKGPQRVVVEAPSDSPSMDQQRLVSEVHRLFEQDKSDAVHFENIKDTLNDHANWLRLLKTLIFEIQEKVTGVTVQAVDNDAYLKKSIATTDAELKEKLRLMEMIITKQGEDIKQTEGQKLGEQLSSGLQTLDAKYGQAVATLEGAVRGLREEMPVRLTEIRTAVASMEASVMGRLSAVETEVTLQAGAAVALSHPGPGVCSTGPVVSNDSAAFPMAFPHTATPAPPMATATRPASAGMSVPMGSGQQHYVGERDFHRSLFDDKIACMPNIMYPVPTQAHHEVALDKRLAWAKTNRNYFISKAGELDMILKYVESFGAEPITPGHVEDMGNRGFMTEFTLPKLSRDMWGYLNLNIPAVSKDRTLFNNANPGNGFDAWRRLIDPLKPNTIERMFEFHRDITRPKKAASVATVIHDIEIWEGELEEYYREGGTKLDERTKLLTAHGMLPDDTNPMIRLSVKNCTNFDSFKKALRDTINFLGAYDCLGKSKSTAHAVEHQPSCPTGPLDPSGGDVQSEAIADVVTLVEDMHREGKSSEDIVAAVRGASYPRGRAPAGAQRQGNRSQSAPSRHRAKTPPRDPKDNKCANCNEKGHTHLTCPQPAKSLDDRACHECGQKGHTARRCPNKGKRSSPARLAITDKSQIAFMIRDTADEDGFRQVLRGARICDIPIKVSGGSQKDRRARQDENRFTSLTALDDSDDQQSEMHDVPTTSPSDSGWATAPRAAASPQRTAPSKHRRITELKGDFDDILAEFSASGSGWSTLPGESPGSSAAPPPPVHSEGSVHRKAKRAHFQIGGIKPRCSDRNCMCDEPGSEPSSSSSHSRTTVPAQRAGADLSSATSGGMNLEVTNCPSPPLPYCGIGVNSNEPNAQLRSDSEQAAMFIDNIDEVFVANASEWQDVDFNVMLDSGCSKHVLPPQSVPGYRIHETALSKSGHSFTVANGEPVANLGGVVANLGLDPGSGEGRTVSSSFAVCDMVSPLMSVHQLCQNGHTCTFSKDQAVVTSSDGEVLCRFQQSGGTYKANLKLKAPSPFGGQGR